MANSREDRDVSVQSVARVLDLLFMVSEAEEPAQPGRLASEVGLPRSTVYRLLGSLTDYGLIAKNKQGFLVTPKFVRLSTVGGRALRITDIAEPYMEDLVGRTGESCGLHLRLGSVRRCIAEVEGTNPIRWVLGVGFTASVLRGAAGHVLMSRSDHADLQELAAEASDDEEERARILTANRQAVEHVRKTNWSLSQGEAVPDAASLAAPIETSSRVVAAINLAAPAARSDDLLGHKELLVEAASEISNAWTLATTE